MILSTIQIEFKSRPEDWIAEFYSNLESMDLKESLVLIRDLEAYIFYVSVMDEEEKSAIKKCTHCGAKNLDESIYCNKCGEKL